MYLYIKKNGLISSAGILKVMKWFEETVSLKDRPFSGSLSLADGHISTVELVQIVRWRNRSQRVAILAKLLGY